MNDYEKIKLTLIYFAMGVYSFDYSPYSNDDY